MHSANPEIYKDPNPKPEIAIALKDDFVACFGFSDEESFVTNCEQNPALKTLAQRLHKDLDTSTEVDYSYFLQEFNKYLFNQLDHNRDDLE